MDLILVAAGGALGALLRYLVSRWIESLFPFSRIPYGTPIVNIAGSFLLAFLISSFIERGTPSREVVLLLGTGFLGAFTTFSTFTYESLALFSRDLTGGVLYMTFNIGLGLLGAYLGIVLGRGWRF